MPSDGGYRRHCHSEEWKQQWRHWSGYREGCEGYWAGYQGPTQVVYSGFLVHIARWSLIANYVCYSTLKTINEDLDKIAAQDSWRLGIYSDLNTTAIVWTVSLLLLRSSKYVTHLTFMVWAGSLTWLFLQLANDLRDTDLLQLLHARLSKNQNLIANKVDGVHEDVKKFWRRRSGRPRYLHRAPSFSRFLWNQRSSMGRMSLSKKSPSCLSRRKHLAFV